MILLGSVIGWTLQARRGFEFGDTFDETIEFANALLGCESQVANCKGEIYSKFGGTRAAADPAGRCRK
jgi:hypothetical protein